ncbi:MAG: Hsp33 family molecular chaperone HslO [Myxococcaceae bacterium]|nr:Hsp33 family molecular chaperone HslO [Myxococcaceae bacterium]
MGPPLDRAVPHFAGPPFVFVGGAVETTDAVLKGLMEATNLTVAVAFVPHVAQEARRRHQLELVSAALLGQAFAGAAVMAALQKGSSRLNLQLECDGALRGLFVDAGADGTMRGYVKNQLVGVELGREFRWRAALGNRGFLSVLRDLGHEYYRSSVELTAFELAGDLNHFFETSEQVKTHLAIASAPRGDEPLGKVAAVLVQALPEGELSVLERLRVTLQPSLEAALADSAVIDAETLFARLFPGVAVALRTPARFACTCSKARTLETLRSLGRAQVQDIIDTAGSTAVTCHFCASRYEVTLPDLLTLLGELTQGEPKN